MKILAVQLLRLGDVISLGPAIGELQKAYPGAQIDLLINDESAKAAPLYTSIQKVHLMPRTAIQSGLGEADRGFFESYDRFNEMIRSIDNENYDLIVNFTQNRFSARLCGLIKAKQKLGMIFEEGEWKFNGPFFFGLNENPHDLLSQYHFTDIFRLAVNSEAGFPAQILQKTERGECEARSQLPKDKQVIAIQPLTSDSKKNWPIENFLELVKLLEVFYPSAHIAILGAPNEKQKLEAEFAEMIERKNISLNVLSIEGAYSFLSHCDLLVTGDTSIKHLAAAAGTPLIEISLGSSQAFATGPYTDGAIVVSPKTSCYPCQHSQSCHRDQHYCSQPVLAPLIAMLVRATINNDQKAMESLAKEFESSVSLARTGFNDIGQWGLEPIGESDRSKYCNSLISRISYKQLMDHGGIGPDIGSACYAVRDQFSDRTFISQKKNENKIVEGELGRLQKEVGQLLLASSKEQALRATKKLALKMMSQSSFREPRFINVLQEIISFEFKGDFHRVKRIRKTIEELITRNKIENKVIRFFETNNEEVQI